MFFRALPLLLGLLAAMTPARAEDVALRGYDTVEVAPTKTSVYIGTVSMTMTGFKRKAGAYTADYVAKVFPFFFYGEKGRLTVELSDDALRRLTRGETVEFSGRAWNEAGEERRVEGKATPADTTAGKLKVRVFVTKKIELIFNTTYQFPPPTAGK